MTSSLHENPLFEVTAGIEINPEYADEWQARNAGATLFQCDIRSLQSSELPEFDVLIGGIPCTSHSNLGRAKKGLAGKPELGDTGDLFLPLINFISERMPAAIVFENVPGFGSSLAGELLVSHLRRIGYHVSTTVLRPNEDWGEIEDRRRWLMVGTLNKPFVLRVPREPSLRPLSAFLDPPDAVQDELDAARIAKTIEGLRAHNARHQEAGHGFNFTVVDGSETSLPTVPKSYYKINIGPFVQTAFGPRLLRQTEIERIHGCELRTRHYATAVQILGQGVLARVFREVFAQLGTHLLPESPTASSH
jgi:DNA (cytosine-5)-methyltransferase 1